MDVDVFVAAHTGEWRRLEILLGRARRARRAGRLTGDEVDELLDLYARAATQLSVARAQFPDPTLLARLSTLVAGGRAAVTGGRAPAWRDAARFLTITFPAAAYDRWRWWVSVAVGFLAVTTATGVWVGQSAYVRAHLLPPSAARELVQRNFADYYSAHPATDFAAQVWTNNAWVTAGALVFGVLAGLPTLWLLVSTGVNTGVIGGYLAAAGKTSIFLGLLLPHGLLELTCVFVASGTGLRLGWRVIDPGPRRRVDALAAEGRSAVTVAGGLALALAVSGVIEAFVTPSGLPTAARIGVGAVALAGFLGWVVGMGRRAVAAGETGDLRAGEELVAESKRQPRSS